MSEAHAPLLPLAFCAQLLGASLNMATRSLNMAAESAVAGTEISAEIGAEMFEFLNEGSSLSSNLVSDLAEGARGELIYGVKEGAKIFSVMIDATEIVFQRCGSAIIGRLEDNDQGVLSKEIGEKIAAAYQDLLGQVEAISTGNDPLMISHNQAMEHTKQSIARLEAESKIMEMQINALQEQRLDLQNQLENATLEEGEELNQHLLHAQNLLKESLSEIANTISEKEEKSKTLLTERREQDSIQEQQGTQMETLELRKNQSKQFLDVHQSRVKSHTNDEVQRILSQHGLESSSVEISEDDENQIRIRIEE